ncbi:FHA modulated ABC efflux pump with fused ATPase and integral membrane subunits [Parafrankia sp. Ea1.12]|uniref:ATP-binding cassette domain-containing protein n=1 Tax=Parafrankia sp. Ea1.12 TaxID=573499 RepID=UPI000DA5102A|nr:ATP-binding cassette domain-containing protein [Parafrankia sp. Ea1.12]SQD99892.1 FHA modulated ABC efflux pump with fused ATPase and integral membrane subunits [Parafrankia sp. Ea1.12]
MDRTTLSVISPAGHNTLTGDAPCVVGRARGADIVINDARVSRRHLVLEPVAGGWHVRDTSANGLWQDGRRMGDTTVRSTEVRFRLGAADGPEVVLVPSSVGLASGAGAGSAPAASAPAPAVPAGPPPRVAGAPGWPSPNPNPGPAPVGPGHTPTPGHAPTPGQAPAPGRAPASGRARVAAPPTAPASARPPVPGGHQPPHAGGPGAAGPDTASAALGLETAQSAIVHARRKMHPLRPGTLRLGRSRDNDISVSDLLASRHHAELLVAPGRVEVVDLGSANGTFLNGQRIGRAQVGQRDVIAIGHHLYQLEGDSLVEYVDSGDVAFEVQALSVFAGTKQLMHDMTFRLPGRSLLGVVGPSGAGKSTLLNALTGFRPADVGSVRYAGRDLYAEYDELRRRIGYVPQADPLHAQLTVREALEYGAELRFPADTTAQERRARVAEVIGELGLTAHADTAVSRLSGGQKKRTSVALELLTRPSLLFLDEPTSGLDPANDQSVMETLKGLAKGGGVGSADESGRTVIVVTHSVLFLDLCDYILVLAPGGHVAYFGPSDGALRFFGKEDFREFAAVFRELESTPGAEMAARFRASEYFVPSAVVAPIVRKAPAELPSVRQQPVTSQLATLTRRYLRVVLADRSYLRLIAAFPFLLGIIPRVIPAPDGLKPLPDAPNPDAMKVLVVLVLCACFMGMANSVREIVKERDIYRRERTIGLSRTAYLGSKIIVLTGITTLQCVIFTLIGLVGRTPPEASLLGSPLVECLAAVIVAALASMMIGLLVSTLVDNADKTMPILVLVTMAQLVLSGGLVSLSGRLVMEQVAWIAPARWGFAALASTDDLNEVSKLGNEVLRTDPADGLWEHSAGIWVLDVVLGLVLGAAALALTSMMLRRIDPKVTRPAGPPPGVGRPPQAGQAPPAGPGGPGGYGAAPGARR